MIGGVSVALGGLSAGGAIDVVSNLSMILSENVTGVDDVKLTALDGADATANQIALSGPIQIESTAGDLALLRKEEARTRGGEEAADR